MSFKGTIKYTIYIFIGAWMFLLGIMVGRGTAPVTFETRGFQERLQAMVEKTGKLENAAKQDEKIALYYYDALNNPVAPEQQALETKAFGAFGNDAKGNTPDRSGADTATVDQAVQEAPPREEKVVQERSDAVPVKTSKKAATFRKSINKPDAAPEDHAPDDPGPADHTPEIVQKKVAATKTVPPEDEGAVYTIQVAAFQSFADAVTQTAILDEKGFSATRTSKKIDGVTWYRVRVGGFASRDAARRHLEKLNQAGINGMIIKKE
jgi:cell division protein FtsN